MQQGVTIKREIQAYYNSPHVISRTTKQCITRTTETTKEQGENKADHGKIKPKKDIDVIAIDQFKKDFKLTSLPSIDFIIPLEFNTVAGKKNSLSLKQFCIRSLQGSFYY